MQIHDSSDPAHAAGATAALQPASDGSSAIRHRLAHLWMVGVTVMLGRPEGAAPDGDPGRVRSTAPCRVQAVAPILDDDEEGLDDCVGYGRCQTLGRGPRR